MQAEAQIRVAVLKSQGQKDIVLANEKLNLTNQQITKLREIIVLKELDEKETEALNDQLDSLIIKQQKLNSMVSEVIPNQERGKLLMQDYGFLQDQVVMQGVNEIEQIRNKISLYTQMVELSKTDENAKRVINELQKQGVDLYTLQQEMILAQVRETTELANAIRDGVKESLYESLLNAEKLDTTLNNVAQTVGKIFLRKNFEKVMDELFKAFDSGGVTIQSQMISGGDMFVQKLNMELPPLFARLGEIVSARIAQSQAAAQLGGTNMPGFNPNAGGGGGYMPSGGQAAQAGKSANFGTFMSGALQGYSLAGARGRDSTSQAMAGLGGGAGQVIGTMVGGPVGGAIGGLLGGLVGSLFGGDKQEQKKPEQPEVAFRLDLSNTLLKDINRNLTAIREDSSAFSLQRSFYFSSSQQQGLPAIIFEGDMVFNGGSGDAGFSAQDVGEVLLQKLSEEGVRGSQ